jgi:hypothetical protein
MTEIEKYEGGGELDRAQRLTDLASEIADEVVLVEDRLREGLEHAIRAGTMLTEAKSLLKHGEWLPWLESNFEWSPRMAQLYMRLSRRSADAAVLRSGSIRQAIEAIAEPKSLPPAKYATASFLDCETDEDQMAWDHANPTPEDPAERVEWARMVLAAYPDPIKAVRASAATLRGIRAYAELIGDERPEVPRWVVRLSLATFLLREAELVAA